MTVRVRFAPSPTGYLHIGGARTALYNYLFAKAHGGKFVLRVEDTDLERSKKEFEESQVSDIHWLGFDYDEGPDRPGEFGPYRQSERTEIYQEQAQKLLEDQKAYLCFCSDEELERKKQVAIENKTSQHYDGTCRNIDPAQASKRKKAGENCVMRFKVAAKAYALKDHVRGVVEFPEDMVGDFVIQRSNGMPVYNFCCVIDDALMKITHVIRGEDHLNNTLRQLMIYEGLGYEPPEFAHVSLLVGKDRQKLSKRHGATSVNNYKTDNYLPQAVANYLALLGWSHPEEKDVFMLEEISTRFDLSRFSKAPALYDIEKLNYINGQHIQNMDDSKVIEHVSSLFETSSEFHAQSHDWKLKCMALFKPKCQFFKDMIPLVDEIFSLDKEQSDEMNDIFSWDTTTTMKEYLKAQMAKLGEYPTEEDFNNWSKHAKEELKIKGKPLFKGLRALLTARANGSDLKLLIPLTPTSILKQRLDDA